MKIVNLVIILILLLTNARGQTCTPEFISSNNDYSIRSYNSFFSTGDEIIFTAYTKSSRREIIYRYDGKTPPRAIHQKQLGVITNIRSIIPKLAPNGNLYFYGQDSTDKKWHLCSWDGVGVIQKLKQHDGFTIFGITSLFKDELLYFVETKIEDSLKTKVLSVINTATNQITQISDTNTGVYLIFEFKDRIYFINAHDIGYHNRRPTSELFYYNPADGAIVKVNTGFEKLYKPYFNQPIVFKDKIVMSIGTKKTGYELFKYDGTGTFKLIKDLTPGEKSGVGSEIINYHGKVYFQGYDDTRESATLYAYNPTNDSISKVHNFLKKSWYSHPFLTTGVYNDKLYLKAAEDSLGTQIYHYNDRTNKVTRITTYKRKHYAFDPYKLVYFKGALYLQQIIGEVGCFADPRYSIMKLNCKNL